MENSTFIGLHREHTQRSEIKQRQRQKQKQ
jgi:hypothetical protein